MVNKLSIVDPNNIPNNRLSNIPVPLEDLTISVQLSVEKKSRSILTSNKEGSYRTTEQGVNISFVQGKKNAGEKNLTTDFTNLTTNLNDENIDEALGITSIDIDFNSSYAPNITIQFIDARGSAIFQNEDKIKNNSNKYSVFFQLPYPLYKLKIKGYYGQQVEYCLHMIKFNSRFNSQSGNFEITAQFVGYTYAMLSDALIGYMRAIPYTNLGKEKYDNLKKTSQTPVLTLDELYKAISTINESVNGLLSSSPEYGELNNVNNKLAELDTVYNILINFEESLLSFLTKEPSSNNIHSFSVFINRDDLQISELKNNYVKNINEAIEKFNQNSKITLDVSTFTDMSYLLYNIEELDNISTDTGKEIKKYLTLNNVVLEKAISIGAIDNRKKLKLIAETKDTLTQDGQLIKLDLSKQLDTSVTSKLGFSPTIRSLFNIITTSIEVLFSVIYDVSVSSEDNQDRKKILDEIFKSENRKNTDIKEGYTIYPWPSYRKFNQLSGYEESYLGEIDVTPNDLDKINEVNFVDELLNAFLLSQKSFEETQKTIKENLINWVPSNVLDTRFFVPNEPFSRENSLNDQDLMRLILLRAITHLCVTNEDLSDEEIVKIAESEYESVISQTPNKDKVLNSLIGKKTEDYLSVSGTYSVTSNSEQQTKKILLLNGDNYIYNYISNFINGINEEIQIIPLNNDFNNGMWPNTIQDLVKKSKKTLFITNYVSTNTIIDKQNDGCLYTSIFDVNEYENFSSLSTNVNTQIKPILLSNLRNYSQSTFNIFSGPLVIQSLRTMNYDDGVNIENFDYRYTFYSHDLSNTNDGDIILSNGLSLSRLDSGSNGVPSKTEYDRFKFVSGEWVQNNTFRTISNTIGFKKSQEYKSYGKNLELSFESSRNGKNIVYPYINFTVFDGDSDKPLSISLFGSRFYYEQTMDEVKALLFLHSFPWKGLNEETNTSTGVGKGIFDVNEIINSFNKRGGFVSVPKLWVYFIGGLLWRADRNEDPIIFYKKNNAGQIVEEFIPTFTKKNKDHYPSVTQYLLCEIGSGIFIKNNIKQLGFSFNDINNTRYKNIDKTLLNLPRQVKDLFIENFLTFVENDWLELKEQLEIHSGDGQSWVNNYNFITNFSNQVILNQGTNLDPNVIVDNNKMAQRFINNNNYMVMTLFYKPNENKFNNNIWLALKDNTKISNKLVSLYKEELILSNTTPKIWGNNSDVINSRYKFSVKKDKLELYLKTISDKFNGQTTPFTYNEESERKQAIFGTTNDNIIKLQIYKNCKNIYDKWLSGVKDGDSLFFQCGNGQSGPKHLIDSFRFLTRSFKDIGDEMAVNPFPLKDYISNNVTSSSYDLITSLLSSNKFNFVPLPNYINYRDPNMVNSIFTTYPTYDSFETTTLGPTFICTYVGESAKHLDFADSNYTPDGFDFDEKNPIDLPIDFTTKLMDKDEPVTVFKVNFGQQNQNIFKDVSLDQSEFSETAEGLKIQDDISQRGNPKNRTLAGQNMYDVWSVRSYKAEIDMMGNAMIQPMMYFQLNNIPLFHGAYMITRVKHKIVPNHMSTNFTGVKIRKPTTKIFSVGDFYMSLLETVENLSIKGDSFSVGSGLITGSYPPIIVSLIETNALNGYFESVQINDNKLKFFSSVPKGIDISSLEVSERFLIPQAIDSLSVMLTDWVSWMSSQNKFKDSNGYYASIISMFRTITKQKELYDSYNGIGVALPGTSRHGWGIAVDLQFNKANGEKISNRMNGSNLPNVKVGFDYTINESLVWLIKNSYRYGWILPYSLRNGDEKNEFWHFEYHGTSAKCLISKNNTFRGPSGTKGSITVSVDQEYKEGVVKNPSDINGVEVIYNDVCEDKFINKSDGTGEITTLAYSDVDPTKKQKELVKNLSGSWSDMAISIIKEFEGFRTKTYYDVNAYRGGYGTSIIIENIGGTPQEATKSTIYTEQTAEITLKYDVETRFKNEVISILTEQNWNKLNNFQKAALISYSYNTGSNRLKTKGIVELITNNDFESVSEEIRSGPITSKGVVLPGLVRRRKIESLLFDRQ